MDLMGKSGSVIDGVTDVPCAKRTSTGSASHTFILPRSADSPFYPLSTRPRCAHHHVMTVAPAGRLQPAPDTGTRSTTQQPAPTRTAASGGAPRRL